MTALRTVIIAVLLTAAPGSGQGLIFEFSFSNPGARSMGFGGAFAALADDATAAFANPAGLLQLVEPEVSLEVRSWSYTALVTQGGRFGGQPTGIGLDTESGLLHDRPQAETTGPSFLSFVYPKRRWSLAVFQHRLANFELSFETQGIFVEGSRFAGSDRRQGAQGGNDLEIVSHGLAAAFRVNDHLSLGVGLSHFDGTMRILRHEYFWDDGSAGSFFGENSFLPERLVASASYAVDDQDWGLNAGLLWQPSERWRVGGFYRQGPVLDNEFEVRAGPLLSVPPPGILNAAFFPLAFPDVYGLGIAFRSADDRLSLSFEWDRVEYSAIAESFNAATLFEGSRFAMAIDDSDELHLGAEYVFFVSSSTLAVRLGLWHEPDHRIGSSLDSPLIRALLPPQGDQMHYAVGFGARFERFQIDLGADFSELRDTVSLSAIYVF